MNYGGRGAGRKGWRWKGQSGWWGVIYGLPLTVRQTTDAINNNNLTLKLEEGAAPIDSGGAELMGLKLTGFITESRPVSSSVFVNKSAGITTRNDSRRKFVSFRSD